MKTTRRVPKIGNLLKENPNWSPLNCTNDFYNNNPKAFLYKKRFLEVMKMIPPCVGLALDIGCSCGIFSSGLAKKGYTVFGLDTYPRVLSNLASIVAKHEGVDKKTKFLVARCEKLPFRKNKFDLVFCGEIIEHLKKPGKLLKEAKRVLKPSGKLIITSPNGGNPTMKFFNKLGFETEGHIQEYTFSEIKKLVEKYDFKILDKNFVNLNIEPITNILTKNWILLKIFQIPLDKIIKKLGINFFFKTILIKCENE